MSDDNNINGTGCFTIFIVNVLVGLFVGMLSYSVATIAAQDKAVEAGVGRHVVDAKTGERTFVYGSVKP